MPCNVTMRSDCLTNLADGLRIMICWNALQIFGLWLHFPQNLRRIWSIVFDALRVSNLQHFQLSSPVFGAICRLSCGNLKINLQFSHFLFNGKGKCVMTMSRAINRWLNEGMTKREREEAVFQLIRLEPKVPGKMPRKRTLFGRLTHGTKGGRVPRRRCTDYRLTHLLVHGSLPRHLSTSQNSPWLRGWTFVRSLCVCLFCPFLHHSLPVRGCNVTHLRPGTVAGGNPCDGATLPFSWGSWPADLARRFSGTW